LASWTLAGVVIAGGVEPAVGVPVRRAAARCWWWIGAGISAGVGGGVGLG